MGYDFTVDVGVVMSGSQLGDPDHSVASLELMKAIESKCGWTLVVDERRRILNQYEQMVKQGFGRDWLRRLATKGRVTFIPWQRLDRGIVTALKEEHFDKEDFKYVETAAAAGCKLLISHDPDYSPPIRRILKKICVAVLHANEAVTLEG